MNGEEREERMTEREKMWAGVTVLVCIGAGSVAIVAAAAILGGWLEYAAGAAGSLLALAGVFIAGWHSGESFERDHGGRVCGAGPEQRR